MRIPLSLSAQERQDLVRALVQEGIGVSGLRVEKPTLESLFLGLTGEGREANT